jgi:hypothetical protein
MDGLRVLTARDRQLFRTLWRREMAIAVRGEGKASGLPSESSDCERKESSKAGATGRLSILKMTRTDNSGEAAGNGRGGQPGWLYPCYETR